MPDYCFYIGALVVFAFWILATEEADVDRERRRSWDR